MTNKITFRKATKAHKEIVFSWLAKPHVQQFWDTTQGHKDDILNFMDGRKEPSSYCGGKYIYWIALANEQPYAMLMSMQETQNEDIGGLKLSHLSKTGNTYGIDYMIGSTEYLGRGYGARTLVEFVDFFQNEFDKKADTFFMDPASDNPRAKRVYEKAGFNHIADFIMGGDCSGSGKPHHLLIKKIPPKMELIRATLSNKKLLENLTYLFIYELSPYYPFKMTSDGTWNKKDNIEKYLIEEDRSAWLIKIYNEVTGFALINSKVHDTDSNYNLAEFFILSRFQRSGLGSRTAHMMWDLQSGIWEVMIPLSYTAGIKFWDTAIESYLCNNEYKKEVVNVSFDQLSQKRQLYTFDSRDKSNRKINLK